MITFKRSGIYRYRVRAQRKLEKKKLLKHVHIQNFKCFTAIYRKHAYKFHFMSLKFNPVEIENIRTHNGNRSVMDIVHKIII